MANLLHILAWEIPPTEEPDRPQSMRSCRVRQLSAHSCIPLPHKTLRKESLWDFPLGAWWGNGRLVETQEEQSAARMEEKGRAGVSGVA